MTHEATDFLPVPRICGP